MLGYPSRSAAFTRADTARGEEDPSSSSYTPETSLLNARKTFPKRRRVFVEEDEKDFEKRAKGERRHHRPTRLTSDPTSIVIRALEVHRLRSEKLKREKTEKVRLEREREKKRLADAQRAATLGKIQKVKEELNLTTTTTTTQKRRGDVGGSIAEEKEEEAKAKEAAAVAASSRKRRDEGEAERAKGGGENPFARGNKKAKKGGKKEKK
jgi:hypothetical protein